MISTIPPVAPLQPTEDSLLLERFLKGDDVAFSVIYNKYVDQLLAYGVGLGGERESLKDVMHDVFYKLYAEKRLLQGVRNLKSYLFQSFRNTLLNSYKSGRRMVGIQPYSGEFYMDVTVMDELIETEERLHMQGEIERYLNSLTDRQREAIYLRFFQEFEYEEVAKLLNMTPHAARKLVSRAIITIREKCPLLFLVLYRPTAEKG